MTRKQAVEALFSDEEAVNRSAEKLEQQLNEIVNSMRVKLTQIERLAELAQTATQDVAEISTNEDFVAGLKAALDNIQSKKNTSDVG